MFLYTFLNYMNVHTLSFEEDMGALGWKSIARVFLSAPFWAVGIIANETSFF